MRITPIISYNYKYNQPSFGVNLESPKLRFKNDDFFVRIKGYGTNSDWAKKIIETADIAVKFIRTKLDFESVLRYITIGVQKANQIPNDLDKRNHSGILRAKRTNWLFGSDWESDDLITHYDKRKSRYKLYNDRFDHVVSYPLKNPYKKFMLTRPHHSSDYGKYLNHADGKYVNHALDMVSDIYNQLNEKFVGKDITTEDLNEINSAIAEMRWILAHATPWERGSDAISNTFIRTIYKALGIKTSPLKRGVSLDLEAYCTNLKDYKENFSDYFSHKPYIVE